MRGLLTMAGFTVADVLEGAHGSVRTGAPGAAMGVSTDSRAIAPGELFVALVGPTHDGHRFLADAFARGAWGALVERRALEREEVANQVAAWPGRAVIAVEDTGRALGDLAGFHRRRMPARVVGITGSNGKTTTKEMTAAIAALRWRVHRTAGNFNNLVGLPLTLLKLEEEHEVAVVEMGTSGPGEIRRLATITAPDVGVVTNVGPVHLEGLGSLAGVIAAKAEIFEGLAAGGTAVLNADDASTPALAARWSGRRITFGLGAGADVRAEEIDATPQGTAFTLALPGGPVRVQTAYLGTHNVQNALAAAAAAHVLGAGPGEIRDGLAAARGAAMRFEICAFAPGVTVVNDAYNANPASMRAALAALGQMPRRGRRAVVLGDMLELGAFSAAEHRALGAAAAGTGADLLVAAGVFGKFVAEGARAAGQDAAALAVAADAEEVAGILAAWLRPGDLLLLKGSRGVRLERVLERLRASGALGDSLEGKAL